MCLKKKQTNIFNFDSYFSIPTRKFTSELNSETEQL